MISFIKRIFKSQSKESKLCKEFNANPQQGWKPLADYFWQEAPDFKRSNAIDYPSASGHVSVCADIYGHEVKISPIDELLDCKPGAYHLNRAQAEELYAAILSCVPGTIYHKDKWDSRIAKGQNVPLV